MLVVPRRSTEFGGCPRLEETNASIPTEPVTRWNLMEAVNATKAESACAEVRPSALMCDLLVAGEDHRMKWHIGVDPLAMCRAVWRTYCCGRREGGSTVAMQFVRVLTGRFERSWQRKAVEMTLAVRLTRYVGRYELPGLYLTVGYYGWRMNGFVQACARLGIDPDECSAREAAMLVARLKYPEPRRCSRERWRQIVNRSEHLIERQERCGRRKARSLSRWGTASNVGGSLSESE